MKREKKIYRCWILIFLLIVAFGMLFSSVAFAQETSIADAIDSGEISAQFTSTGYASGHIADLTVTNTGSTEITLDLENSGLEGEVLDNPNTDEQPEVITDTPGISSGPSSYTPADTVTLQPMETVTIPVIGYCLDFAKATPSTGVVFDLTSTTPGIDMDLVRTVIDTIENYTFPAYYTLDDNQTATQIAIWAAQPVNEDVTLSDYAGRGYILNDNDVAVVRDALDQSGVSTDNIVALSGTGKDEVDGDGEEEDGLEFPWIYILIPVIVIIASVLIGGAIRAFKKPGGKEEEPPIDSGADKVVVKGPVASSYANKKEECEKLKRKCDDAKKAAKEAENKAQETEKKAEEAQIELGEAGEALQEAKEARQDADSEPEAKGSWAESEGRRVTSHDLKLKKSASKALWEQYQSGEIDAETLEKGWEELDEKDALDELRKKDKESRMEPAEEVLDKAEMDVEEAEEKAEKTKNEAESAKDEAKNAKEKADNLCKEAEECFEQLKAEAEKAKAAKAAEGKAEGPKEGAEGEEPELEPEEAEEEDTRETEETRETETETREETRETKREKKEETWETQTETRHDVHERSMGVQGIKGTNRIKTIYFGPRLGEPGMQQIAVVSKPIEYLKDAHEPWKDFWGVRSVYGTTSKDVVIDLRESREPEEWQHIYKKSFEADKKIQRLPFTTLDPTAMYLTVMQITPVRIEHDKHDTQAEKKIKKRDFSK